MREVFQEWVKSELRKYPFTTSSALVLKWYYHKPEGKFTELRSIAEQTKKIFLQR